MNHILCSQLAIDYCCTPQDVSDNQNHFTEHKFLEGRRRFQEGTECLLKLAVINGKILFTGKKEIIEWCRSEYAKESSEWFLEAKNLRRLNDRLFQDGYQIETTHPFFIPADGPFKKTESGGAGRISETCQVRQSGQINEIGQTSCEIRWYQEEEIGQFRGDSRFNEAYAFCKDAPDVLGVAAVSDGKILGMAGASCDSPTMWQIGINVDPDTRMGGTGKLLVSLLKDEIMKRGILPYYGTSMSHIASQRVALGAGFVPAWAELVTSRVDDHKHMR